jgi:hypothetical protein
MHKRDNVKTMPERRLGPCAPRLHTYRGSSAPAKGTRPHVLSPSELGMHSSHSNYIPDYLHNPRLPAIAGSYFSGHRPVPAKGESSLHVTNTTYSGLQEHRIIVYTATGQKAKPKVHLSMESTVTAGGLAGDKKKRMRGTHNIPALSGKGDVVPFKLQQPLVVIAAHHR